MEKENKTQFKMNRRHITIGFAVSQLIVSILLGIQVIPMNVLPIGYIVALVFLVIVFNGATIASSKKQWSTILMGILSVLISALMIYGMVAINKVDDTVDKVTDKPNEVKTEMVVVVLQDSEAETITDLSQYLVAYMEEESHEGTEKVIEEINDSVGGEVTFHEFTNIVDMVDALYAKTMNAMIINKAYIDTIDEIEGYTDFSSKIKIIYSSEVVNYINLVEKGESDLDTFVVYISGIDTFGHVSVNSRSDVNILAVVNTQTKKVQLINTPRDYYVTLPISNGMQDKLTHAGIYGVDNSMGALENLYGVEVDYFLRMNFSGFETIIDSLGGIDVYSEYDFTVEPIKHYTVGMNHLSGIEALAFARERYSFAAGDIQRGKNQMAVITAMISKMTSKEFLYNYTEVLDAISGSFQTNFTSEEIYSLVKMQLADPSEWTIESYSVTGTGDTRTTYTTPNTACYVMLPNESDVQEAKNKIQQVLQGK